MKTITTLLLISTMAFSFDFGTLIESALQENTKSDSSNLYSKEA
ncbi:MAG: hypothetical protein U9Q29_01705 [Campylobacterota bacterium]|nr:hypothetical protein [Campylobacterota bacterium]